jgi:fumarate reductase subunit D
VRKRRVEPLVWLMFSGGGVLAAVFLPVLAVLFGLALPLGWLSPPDYGDLRTFVTYPVIEMFLFALVVLLLVHSAHRFRYTLYDGLQVKAKRTVAVLCYGGAAIGAIAAFAILVKLG